MAGLRIIYDEEGQSLVVWFGEPGDEAISEEVDDADVILMRTQKAA